MASRRVSRGWPVGSTSQVWLSLLLLASSFHLCWNPPFRKIDARILYEDEGALTVENFYPVFNEGAKKKHMHVHQF